jgi:hypothetical protein
VSASPVDELFTVDPSEFVARRDALAKQLRGAGEKDAAAAVKALRRPSVSVWALNSAARSDPHVVRTFVDTVAEARTAQADALRGGGRDALRDAIARQRDSQRAVLDAARRVVDDSGRSGDGYERELEDALSSIAGSEPLAAALRAGTLTTLTAGAGEDLFATLAATVDEVATATAPPAPRAKSRARRPEPAPAEPSPRVEKARDEVARHRDDVATIEAELHDAERAARDAEQALERAQRTLDAATNQREEARTRLDKARHALARAAEKLAALE